MLSLISLLVSTVFISNPFITDMNKVTNNAFINDSDLTEFIATEISESPRGSLLNTNDICDLNGAHKTLEECFRANGLQIYNVNNNSDQYYLVIFSTDSEFVLINSLSTNYLGVVYNRHSGELVDRMYLDNSKDSIINGFRYDY